MKQFALLAVMTALVMGSFSCESLNEEEENNNICRKMELTTKSAAFAQQGNTFAFDFISRVNAKTEGDFIISPLSMQFLLGMILDGAQGQTADEICQVLGYGAGEEDEVNAFCLSMLQQLPKLDKNTTLSLANAIVVNKQYALLANYKSTVSKFYEAEVSNHDFSDATGTARQINQWCSQKTNGLIPKVLDDVNPNALAYLMNALYFKSKWQAQFSGNNTAKENFTREDGSMAPVQMMKNKTQFSYGENETLRAVRLPYGNGAFSMTVVMPSEGKKLSDVIGSLSGSTWLTFNGNMRECNVDLWLPRFETRFHIEVNDILSAMGMPSSFNVGKADFTAMSNHALCLSLVQQDAVIKVDEEGAEAAAVSMAEMRATYAPSVGEVVFHADRPFLYLITETSTGVILFAGKYSGK